MIFIAGITIAIFFELLLIVKKEKSDADKVLIVWMFLIALHVFLFFMNHTQLNQQFTFILGVELPFPLLQGVMLYLYVATATNQLPKKKALLTLHFLPAAVAYIYLIANFYFLSPDEKVFVYQKGGMGYEPFLFVLSISYSVLGVLYIAWSLLLLKKHKENIVCQYSDIEKVSLNWLRILIWGMAVIWIVIILFRNDVYNFYAVVLFVFAIGFFGIKQIAIPPPIEIQPESETVSQKAKGKYLKSGLKEEQSAEYYQKLKKLMTEEKVFTQSELLINDLASKLKIHPNHLSQIINEREGKNFYEFINSYRVEEFKKLASSPKGKQYTLLSLALECGFNSKSSFNRYFKKSTGQTPSQYFAQLG